MTSAHEDPNDPRPVAPPKPQAGECCESGCDRCVYDRYWDAMEHYERALAEWERRRQAHPLHEPKSAHESK